jgi:hypothetical protein
MPSHGTHGYRCISPDFKLAREQLLHAFTVLDDHHKVDGFYTGLSSPTSAANSDERRRTPASRRTTSCHTFAMFGSEDESSFDQVGDDGDALGLSS